MNERSTTPDDDRADRPIEIPITDVLDLHPFRPNEVNSVVSEYLDAAFEQGLSHLRIVHGRGTGSQRRAVRTLLERDSRVASFGDAPAQAGGWGATCLSFHPEGPEEG